MRLKDLPIGLRLGGGFLAVILLTALYGWAGLREMSHLAQITLKLYRHPLSVGRSVREVRISVLDMDRRIQALDPGDPRERVEEVERFVRAEDVKVAGQFALVGERFLGDPIDVRLAEAAFEAWKPARDEVLRLLASPSQAGLRAAEERSNALLQDLDAKCRVMVDFARGKADAFMKEAEEEESEAILMTTVSLVGILLVGAALAFLITRSLTVPLGRVVGSMRRIAAGDFGHDPGGDRGDEVGELIASFREMQVSLKDKTAVAEAVAGGDLGRDPAVLGEEDRLGLSLARMISALRDLGRETSRRDWLKSGQTELAARVSGENDLQSLGSKALGFLAEYLGARVGAFYVLSGGKTLVLTASYAFTKRKGLSEAYDLGEGLVGQAAFEKKAISIVQAPTDYLRIASGLGEAAPANIVAVPLVHEGEVAGVVELGSFAEFSDQALQFLELVADGLAVAVASIQARSRLQELLAETRLQASRLQEQQEELRAANEELEEQTQALRASEEELKTQQEELQAANEELEEKNDYLEKQKVLVNEKNAALQTAQEELERKAEALERTGRYKSEFLANMSHELRTPLNSVLLLARSLAENVKGNLLPDQVESARIIQQSGNGLLQLINEILDLSKIESGRMTLNLEEVSLSGVAGSMRSLFGRMAADKGLDLVIDVADNLRDRVVTDSMRLEQILKNLISNALKFTEKGRVGVRFFRPAVGAAGGRPELAQGMAWAVSVEDTGIGIPPEKQQDIFEAFQQADGSTSRKYGGTGLGLTISRELARLLGGELLLDSEPGKGSTFTLLLPLAGPGEAPARPTPRPEAARIAAVAGPASPAPSLPPVQDDRGRIRPGDRVILVVEDDPVFAGILAGLCRERGFKVLTALTGEDGLALALADPPSAVILDIKLPGKNGWEVLGELKADSRTRHIPVHVMSGLDAQFDALRLGAVGFLSKPADRESLDAALSGLEGMLRKDVKDLLVVEDDPGMQKGIVDLVGDQDVSVEVAATGEAALEALSRKSFDCMILDLGLPDMTGFELLNRLEARRDVAMPPVIVYTGRDLTREEERELRRFSGSIIVKSAKSEERLLDEASLFLHRMVDAMPTSKRRMLASLQDRDAVFRDKIILVVDDDMRNLFAVSRILEEKGAATLKAEDGKKALDLLKERPDVDLVLLDIMMPVMDGYETLKAIRGDARLARLPVIALTAKAMREDRDRCLAAGANDYLSKPLDVDRFLSMMRVWLCK